MAVAPWEQGRPEGRHEPARKRPEGESGDADRERLYELQLRVQYLEAAAREREEVLAREKERSARAHKKVKQLLGKLSERDEALAETRRALQHLLMAGAGGSRGGRSRGGAEAAPGGDAGACEDRAVAAAAEPPEAARAAAAAARPGRARQARGGAAPPCGAAAPPSAQAEAAEAPVLSGSSSVDANAAARERAEIVSQLERHLTQMRTHLEGSEKEARELEGRVRAKEAEWNGNSKASQPTEVVRAHWQALHDLRQQAQEKRGFAMDLCQKTRRLEEQISAQRELILDDAFCSVGVERGQESEGSVHENDEHLQRQKALRAFLDAAGAAGEALRARPALRAALKARPPRLTGEAAEQCRPEERTQMLSLFAAWAAVSGDSPCALHVSDLMLAAADADELRASLATCGAQLQEWHMARCPAESEAATRALCAGLATQPLRRLSLGYNCLGVAGSLALANVCGAWSASLEYLGLEMNGLGDQGCEEVARALERGSLPQLRHLELGWNELSASSRADARVAADLPRRGRSPGGGGRGAAAPGAAAGEARPGGQQPGLRRGHGAGARGPVGSGAQAGPGPLHEPRGVGAAARADGVGRGVRLCVRRRLAGPGVEHRRRPRRRGAPRRRLQRPGLAPRRGGVPGCPAGPLRAAGEQRAAGAGRGGRRGGLPRPRRHVSCSGPPRGTGHLGAAARRGRGV
ncbi:unnamed protein product [Prorocentrum cordatum]|uniref:Uncharacterized protein n=1 Tax=Prorocentrum cordatum TaxID=2364126 RepID=A0ABN9UA00_9DINO|nr:unnamed protein product [Polarella glacialis]